VAVVRVHPQLAARGLDNRSGEAVVVGVGVRADEQAHVLEAQSGLMQRSLELRERAGLAEAGVDEHHSVAGGDRVGVDVGHPRPGQRKAQAPEAGEDPVGASELALAGSGRRGGQARDARTEQIRESTAAVPLRTTGEPPISWS
jgi:hypothetical protein